MGGLGSGAIGWKPKAEHLPKVDIRTLPERRTLREGQTIFLTIPDSAYGVRVHLTFTELTYGGQRPWFVCPACAGRVAILYLYDQEYKCGQCHDVTYITRCEHQPLDTMVRKERALLAKFKGAFPFKPKYMHMTAYIELTNDYIKNAKAIDRHLDKQFGI